MSVREEIKYSCSRDGSIKNPLRTNNPTICWEMLGGLFPTEGWFSWRETVKKVLFPIDAGGLVFDSDSGKPVLRWVGEDLCVII